MNLTWSSRKFEEVRGLNDAGVNYFGKDNINSFVREMLQNSVDARDKEALDPKTGEQLPLKVKIRMIEVDKNEFPLFEEYYSILKKIEQFNEKENYDRFFRNIYQDIENDKIRMLVIEDYNTTGLEGSDKDRHSTFYRLVRGEGLTKKQDKTSGGSYGIGKNAIFGLSKSRTVFFCSKNNDDEYIFSAVAKLASYEANGDIMHKNVFLGDENTHSVRELSDLPEPCKEIFNRKEVGTSQFAVCPRIGEEWAKNIEYSILQNYWKLIYDGQLEVEIYEQDRILAQINSEDLETKLKEYYDPKKYNRREHPKGYAFDYYKTFKKGSKIVEKIENFGTVEFYFRETKHGKSKYVSFIRNGMVIDTNRYEGYGNIKYCGVLICTDERGNEILKLMENPTHDAFEPARLDERSNDLNSDDGKRFLSKIEDIIKDGLDSILEKFSGQGGEESWLDDFFNQAMGARKSGGSSRTGKKSQDETPQRTGKDIEYAGSLSSTEPNSLVNQKKGTKKGPGPGKRNGKKKNGKKRKRKNQHDKIDIESRIFLTGEIKEIDGKKHKMYKIILRSDDVLDPVDIQLVQKADSGEEAIFSIGEANYSDGKRIHFNAQKNEKKEVSAYRLHNIEIPCSLEVYINEPFKSSFKVN